MLYRQTVLSTAVGLGFLAVCPSSSLAQAATPVAELLPENTPVALMVETDQATWDQLLQYELFDRITEFTGQPLSPGGLPFLPYGVDYQTDVAPWVGDGAAIALLPIPSAATISPQDRGYLVVSITDAEAIPDFIDVLAEARQATPEETSYKGVPIYFWPTEVVTFDEFGWPIEEPAEIEDNNSEPDVNDGSLSPLANGLTEPFSDLTRWLLPQRFGFRPAPSPDIDIDDTDSSDTYSYTIPGLAMALFDDHLVVSLEPDTLRYWIEYQQRRGPVLTENEDFLAVQADAEEKGAFGLVYGSIGELAKFTVTPPSSAVFPLPLPDIPEPTLRERTQAAALFRNVTFEILAYPRREGLHLEARLNDGNFLIPLPRGTVDNDGETILSELPASTYMLGSGYDLAGLWDDVSDALSLAEISRSLLETARAFVSFATGLDLDTEILGWMDGEYTLFFFPSRSGLFNSFLPGVGVEAGVLLQTSDRPLAETALTAFDTLVGPSIATPQQLSGTDVVSWEFDLSGSGTPQSILSHTWLTDDTLAITTGTGAMDRLVNPFAFESLTEHSTFLNATEPFPDPNYGYFYVNAAPTLATIYSLFDLDPTDPFIQEIKSGLGTVRSVSITTSSTADAVQLDALLGLAQREP